MKIDEEGALEDKFKAYQDYVDDVIKDASLYCDALIEGLLYYKYILSLEYDINTVSSNISDGFDKFDKIYKDSKKIEDIVTYIYSEKIDVKLSDFQGMEISGKLLRDYKIYNLINKNTNK